MRSITAALLIMLAAPAMAAEDLSGAVEVQGRISISPQLCGIPLDRDAQNALLNRLQARYGIYDMQVRVFSVNNRIAKASSGWSAAERQAFCAEASGQAKSQGLLK